MQQVFTPGPARQTNQVIPRVAAHVLAVNLAEQLEHFTKGHEAFRECAHLSRGFFFKWPGMRPIELPTWLAKDGGGIWVFRAEVWLTVGLSFKGPDGGGASRKSSYLPQLEDRTGIISTEIEMLLVGFEVLS